ncbi:glutaredoxin family protein [Rhodococcus jostii]|uniref:glutaredoxin family protein n=1 Tax=Rhodococcus jostii TaxID=132919 RepID=UPI0036264A6E
MRYSKSIGDSNRSRRILKPATLFSRRNCQPCMAVERRLIKNGTPYVKLDVSEDADAAAKLKQWGFTAVPVLVSGNTYIFGYSPDRIDALMLPDVAKEIKRGPEPDRTGVEDKG